jgi:hypothetical protein
VGDIAGCVHRSRDHAGSAVPAIHGSAGERIRAVNEASMQQETGVEQQLNARSQTLLLYGCPLSGPIHGLTAWAMTRVQTAG